MIGYAPLPEKKRLIFVVICHYFITYVFIHLFNLIVPEAKLDSA